MTANSQAPGRFEAVSFDLYGTLLTTNPDQLPVVKIDGTACPTPLASAMKQLSELWPTINLGEMLAAYTAAVAQTRRTLQRRRYRELPPDHTFKLCLQRLGVARANDSRMLQRAFHMACLDAARALPGAIELLRSVSASGRRIGIISNLPDTYGWDRLAKILERPQFDFVILSGEVGWRKPSPRIFSAAISELRLPASSVLHVGDEFEADVIGASEFGMGTAWVSSEARDLKPMATYQLSSLDALLPLL